MNTESTTTTTRLSPLPPRWFIRTAWVIHRWIYRFSGGRRGLWPPKGTNWGTMRLHSIGRRTGTERIAILAYFEDGPNLVTLAMNGWGAPEPAWWLNLQAQPDVVLDFRDGPRNVRARIATPDERARLWDQWRGYYGDGKFEGWAARRPRETAVVVFEPR